jgi:hypothetical protein
MHEPIPHYDEDFFAWTQTQAALLRAQVLSPVTYAYVLDIARECRDVLQQVDGDREDHGRTGV